MICTFGHQPVAGSHAQVSRQFYVHYTSPANPLVSDKSDKPSHRKLTSCKCALTTIIKLLATGCCRKTWATGPPSQKGAKLIDLNFTFNSTQNTSFWRRSPSQSLGLLWKN